MMGYEMGTLKKNGTLSHVITQLMFSVLLVALLGTSLLAGFAQTATASELRRPRGNPERTTSDKADTNGTTASQAKNYYDSSGSLVRNAWIKSGGKYYYLNANGNPVTNDWATYNGKYCYLNANGNPVTNDWVTYNGNYYYLNARGNPVANTYIAYNGKYYCFNKQAQLIFNSWLYYGGAYYYCGPKAALLNGLQTISGEAYIFNNDYSLRTISNDQRLDNMVCRIIRDVTGFSARNAYDYVAYSFTYEKGSTSSNFANWEEYYALGLLDTGKGNCFGYSSLYHFLLKAMGYSSKTIAGIVMNRRTGILYDHCWVEVYLDGATYVCDPVFEVAYTYSGIYSYFITYEDNAAADIWLLYYST